MSVDKILSIREKPGYKKANFKHYQALSRTSGNYTWDNSLIQMDASPHDWLYIPGGTPALIDMVIYCRKVG
jgi:hypothetical protein